MVQEVESPFVTSDGHRLYGKIWKPDETPRAHLIFIHGFNDRCEIHGPLFPTLASSPYSIQVHSYDQRGWGKSALEPKQQGDTGPTSQVLRDIHDFVKHVATTIPDIEATPVFLMGHSMGGQETLHYVLSTEKSLTTDRPKLSGYITVAPYISLDPSTEPSALLVFTGKLAARLLPKFQMKQQLDHRYITRDPAFNLSWEQDPLCPKMGTLEGLSGMLQRAADLAKLSHPSSSVPHFISTKLPVPTLWLHGTDDKICAYAPSKALFDRLSGAEVDIVPHGIESKTFKTYEKAYHKLQCEPDGLGEQFSKDVATWIRQVVDAKTGTSSITDSRAKL